MRRWLAAGFIALFVGGASYACGSDYGESATTPDAGTLVGDRGGKCFDDGRCKEGLTCIDTLCVLVDAGDPGSASEAGAAPDASADAADAGCRLTFNTPALTGTLTRCGRGASCDASQVCCGASTPTDEWTCVPTLNCGVTAFECDTSDECGSGGGGGGGTMQRCCVGNMPRKDGCGVQTNHSRCALVCEATELSTCDSDAACLPGQSCMPTTVVLGQAQTAIAMKLCRKP